MQKRRCVGAGIGGIVVSDGAIAAAAAAAADVDDRVRLSLTQLVVDFAEVNAGVGREHVAYVQTEPAVVVVHVAEGIAVLDHHVVVHPQHFERRTAYVSKYHVNY